MTNHVRPSSSMDFDSHTMPPNLPSRSGSPWSLSIIPIEIWERAIDWLVEDYIRTSSTTIEDLRLRRNLSNCALVCTAWKHRAQFHLFTHLLIKGYGLSRYGKLIIQSPSWCGFAKEFFFYNEHAGPSGKPVETASQDRKSVV